MGLFDGQVAIISGAGPGVGTALSRLMAKEGANLVLGARTASRLEGLAKEINGMGREAICRTLRHHQACRLQEHRGHDLQAIRAYRCAGEPCLQRRAAGFHRHVH